MKNDKKKTPKNPKKFYCENCDFLSSNKKDFNRHVLTRKHNFSQKQAKKTPNVDFKCFFCPKKYKYQSGLSRHKRKCKNDPNNFVDKMVNLPKNYHCETESSKNEKDISLKALLMQQIKQQNKTIELLKESIKTNSKIIPNIGNNNNNTISINVFLNKECSNAMNLTDFIDNMKVSLDDLNYSKNNGYIQGVTNIFAKQLKDLKPTERPIHCSDKKRLQFYIKDDNKWSKDSNDEKIDKTINNIKMKQTSVLTEWEKLHPNYPNEPVLLDEWQKMLSNVTEDPNNSQPSKIKIALKRNIANHTQLKEAMEKK
tara:strand:+ start:2440 stop:3375 length:936 start_codon:yes stop_codon:yes gene_type:complete